jgi:ent-copalyl diphosphate synthase
MALASSLYISGMLFFRDNLCKLEDENAEHMPIGFEVAFPSLLAIAKKLDIEVPDDSSFLQEIYARRNLKLKRLFDYTNFSHNCVS